MGEEEKRRHPEDKGVDQSEEKSDELTESTKAEESEFQNGLKHQLNLKTI